MQVQNRHVTGSALGYGAWVVYSQVFPFYGYEVPPLEGPDFLAVIAMPWLAVVGIVQAWDKFTGQDRILVSGMAVEPDPDPVPRAQRFGAL